MKIVERQVQEIGSSLLITLPKKWTTVLNIKKGSTIKLIQSESGALTITPEYTQQEQAKHATIMYGEQLQRQFFREYFEGNETITVTFEKQLTKTQREQLQTFLSRFMNVQSISETNKKLVVKCFKIDELTMEECLNRMHHLTISMLDEKSSETRKEMRDTTTRFYYMLVMQVRRYLTEGKYTQDKQISLIRAMDYRMVGEKMQRIAELSFTLKGNKSLIAQTIDCYKKAFSHYMNKEYEKALSLWTRINDTKKKAANNSELSQFIRLTKEISMLVR